MTEENIKEQEKTAENQEEQAEENTAATEVSNLEEENKSLNDKILRLAAELENTRRRSEQELQKAHKYAVSNFAGDLVVVLENFYLASDNLPEEEIKASQKVKNFADAVVMTKKELSKTLEKHGITRIYPLGEKFDPNFHEAVAQVPAEEAEEDGVVKQVIQSGYSIKERLIRPALVAVTNKSE